MGWEIPAGAVVSVVIAFATWMWKLSSKLTQLEDKAETASKTATSAATKASLVGADLAEHKEHVAAEYVSRGAMKEITDAINRLGDRLDALFMHLMPRP
jgi:hypothetical protein